MDPKLLDPWGHLGSPAPHTNFPKRFPKHFHKKTSQALAVIVIFVGQIAAGSSVFDLCAFLLACLVVLLVRIYGLAGKAGESSSELK
jgi:hypothetical protein